MTTSNYQKLVEKWAPILEHESFSPISDSHRRSVTATILENTERALAESGDLSANMTSLLEAQSVVGTGGYSSTSAPGGPVAGYDPVLISLVRQAMPNMMAYDICGVQPMTGPTGLIFAMRSKFTSQAGDNAMFNEAPTDFSSAADPAHAGATGEAPGGVTTGDGFTTTEAEALGTGGGDAAFAEMAFAIEKVSVTAKTRALKAEYTTELAQDLKAVHGLDAESELANILQTEILAEINREVVRTIYTSAVGGAVGTAAGGTFDLDVDANGRWSVEKFKGLMFQIEQEANAISKATRRGKGNIVICSSDVASALQMAGVLDYTPALGSNSLQVDDTGNTFAGVLNGRYRVYIDPYSGANYMVVGYKGSSSFDAGLFYCPYVPLQMVRAVGENTFQPKIGFKTRYGMVANPFAGGNAQGLGAITANSNQFYRRVAIANLF